jgi:hypothetical protein
VVEVGQLPIGAPILGVPAVRWSVPASRGELVTVAPESIPAMTIVESAPPAEAPEELAVPAPKPYRN